VIFLVWDASAARKQIFSGDRIDEDGKPIKSKCSKYFLQVLGNGDNKGDYKYPIGTPSQFPNRGALIAAYQRASQFAPELHSKIKNMANRYGIKFPAISQNEITINAGLDTEFGGGKIRVPMILMRTGIYNNLEKVPEQLEEAAPGFNHRPITIFSEEQLGHTENGVATNNTVNVGKIEGAIWREDTQDIFGYGVLDESRTPDWLINRINNGENLGISAAYWHDTEDNIETNYIIDNVSILEPQKAACEPPNCGLNLNTKTEIKEEDNMTIELNEKIILEKIEQIAGMKQKIEQNAKEMAELNEQIEGFEAEKIQMKEQFDADLKGVVAEKDKAIGELTEKISGYETEIEKSKFLKQFPEGVEVPDELIEAYIKNPENIVREPELNEKYIKLMTPKGGEHTKVSGEEFPEQNSKKLEESKEDDEFWETHFGK